MYNKYDVMKEAIRNCKTFSLGDKYDWYIQTYGQDKRKSNNKKKNFFCIKSTKFTKNNSIKVKRELEGKVNLYLPCYD